MIMIVTTMLMVRAIRNLTVTQERGASHWTDCGKPEQRAHNIGSNIQF